MYLGGREMKQLALIFGKKPGTQEEHPRVARKLANYRILPEQPLWDDARPH